MADALIRRVDVKMVKTKFRRARFHVPCVIVLTVVGVFQRRPHRRHRVVGNAEGQFRVFEGQIPFFEIVNLRRRDLRYHMTIDEQQRKPVAEIAHDMPVPDFFKQRLRHQLLPK